MIDKDQGIGHAIIAWKVEFLKTRRLILMMLLLGRRQRRHPLLEAFAATAGLTETKQAGTPFA
jgi:hypothetical protein